ncbi:MAG: hypothetical protein DHS20C02_01140 [Micavibrio sp.]|nr:MAG: hypothetical protein DHS20C02_01140 [Micavibrio sp.]
MQPKKNMDRDSLQKYFLVVTTSEKGQAEDQAIRAEKDILQSGGYRVFPENYGTYFRMSFQATSEAAEKLKKKHKVYIDLERL